MVVLELGIWATDYNSLKVGMLQNGLQVLKSREHEVRKLVSCEYEEAFCEYGNDIARFIT